MRKIVLYIALVILMTNCKTSKISANTPSSTESYKELVTGKLGNDVLYLTNKTNSHVLCIHETKGTSQQPRNKTSFLVVKIDTNSIVFEDYVENSTVGWASKYEVEVFKIPGMVRKDQSRDDFVTIYNVESGKSYPKKNTEQH